MRAQTENTMLKLIKNARVFAPEELGAKDVLLAGSQIVSIQDSIEPGSGLGVDVIDARGRLLIPGLIDAHVHLTGGGGEGGFKTRTPEIQLSALVRAGITTVVGCLGTDATTRSMANLVAKARGLIEEGISAYCYTGSYQYPVTTLTGSIREDIVFIPEIVGVGEIALSDHRSSQMTAEELARVAADARVAGMLAGKAGAVHIHMGPGERRFELIEEVIKTTEIPISQFIPTHVDRNYELFLSGLDFAKRGGVIDLTTSTTRSFPDEGDVPCSRLLKRILDAGISIDQVSFSSDGQGSLPLFDEKGVLAGLGVGDVATLFSQIRDSVAVGGVPLSTALKVATVNPARNLQLRNKGNIAVGNDADLVLLDEAMAINTVIARGQIMVRDGQVLVKGTFE